MTPDERDRLTRLEADHASLKDWMRSIDAKVDDLRTIASMGRGVLWFCLKAGAVAVAVGALAAWLYDRFAVKLMAHP